MHRYCALITGSFYLLFPLEPELVAAVANFRGWNVGRLTYATVIATTGVGKVSNGICFVICALFINNSVDSDRRGALNGTVVFDFILMLLVLVRAVTLALRKNVPYFW
eukprot:m.24141 g.24141  ORF g.24141 m.24141 type:complete len:108 (+) comp13018_c0_seq2:147-470(+)